MNVSEKAAALDVVRDRLHNAGLGHFLLELHSHKATRKEVAAELGRTLNNVVQPPPEMAAISIESARQLRQELNAYADAMNQQRQPLGVSLHEVLGQISHLHEVPAAPSTGIAPANLTVASYQEIRQWAAKLAAAWRPASQGSSFLWRGVTEQGSLDARLYSAESALGTLRDQVRINSELAEMTGLTRPSGAARLSRLLDHLAARPADLPEEWLSTGVLADVPEGIGRLDECLASISAREASAASVAGMPWNAIPRAESLPAVTELPGLVPAAIDARRFTAAQLTALSQAFSADADMLAGRRSSLAALAALLGLREPVTFTEADNVLTVALLAESPDRPERAWLTLPGLEAASRAAAALRQAHESLAAAEVRTRAYYLPAALGEDTAGLAGRLGQRHGLGKLSGEYRRDKKTLVSLTMPGVTPEAAQQHLHLTVAWQQAARWLQRQEREHAAVLCAYYTGTATSSERLARAQLAATTAVTRTGGQDMTGVAAHLALDSAPDQAVLSMARDISADLRGWRSGHRDWPPELLGGTIGDAASWLRAHQAPLDSMARFAQAVSQAGRPLDLAGARQLVAAREQVEAASEQLAGQAAAFAAMFGGLYDGLKTDMDGLRLALEWTRTLRVLMTGNDGPLTEAQAKTALTAPLAGDLGKAAGDWRRAAEDLLSAFDDDRRQDLAAELDDYTDAAGLIAELRQDTGGQHEWHAYQQARAKLAEFGLAVAVDFCASERVPATAVPQVLERALLQEWADHQLRTDPALAQARAVERDTLVAEYRKLDTQLITAAAGTIVRACNRRRPRTDVGESAVISREAARQRKHMPVRTLIDKTRTVTQAIKPCFMMSPLSVSQFLPPDLEFDAVIFDEASQVSPGDAINCIYRGKALILAGDQKQLPPSSFFSGATGDDGDEWTEDSDQDNTDFESVLDLAKGAGAFRALTLRWHYRSRHEALIAFSNASFYEGKLITFPGAHDAGPDVGVELFHTSDGVYRRGSSRDNPVEAAKVAERVIHHYATRPRMSLGVITFSESQASAIDAAVRQARQERPELGRFFDTGDRLRGFFVKSLESVQGDERDVLIFSVGYGPDENGKFTLNFGPLNRQGGWRRLNVAVTRAQYRNEIVASIRASDIPESAPAEGVRQLRRYLDYAERGPAALALDTSTGGDAESPFEESVISVIRSWGYEVTPQVGTAGYRIDIGVKHPDHAGVFALGVECDGYQYHSSQVARDRDRLREQVLVGLGWRLHRIWGTAWYRDRNGQEQRLRAAIEEALAAPVHGLLTMPEPATAQHQVTTEPASFGELPTWANPYQVAYVTSLPRGVEPGTPGSSYHMVAAIRRVVDVEGPVHISVLHQRLRDAWNIGRVGAKIRENIDDAIRQAGILRDGDFLLRSVTEPAIVRTPADLCHREIGQVHDMELSAALLRFTRDAGGISEEELTSQVASLYGWQRRGPGIATRLQGLIEKLLRHGYLTGSTENLHIGKGSLSTAKAEYLRLSVDALNAEHALRRRPVSFLRSRRDF